MNMFFHFTAPRRCWALTVLVLALLVSTQSLAQVARLYTNRHGLKTNNCHSVDIDSRGLVWVSGANTLGIFDGWRFYYYPIENKEGRQLFQNSYRVQEATDNHYWICTSHGLYMLDARTAEFHRFFLSEREDSIYGYATNAIIDYPKYFVNIRLRFHCRKRLLMTLYYKWKDIIIWKLGFSKDR